MTDLNNTVISIFHVFHQRIFFTSQFPGMESGKGKQTWQVVERQGTSWLSEKTLHGEKSYSKKTGGRIFDPIPRIENTPLKFMIFNFSILFSPQQDFEKVSFFQPKVSKKNPSPVTTLDFQTLKT